MEQKTEKKGQLLGGLFTMLLFLVFILSALFTVLTGSRVYENITARSDRNFSSVTALSYIANKVRQGDLAEMADIKEIEGTQVLELRRQIGGTEYVTWIYWLDGSIRELFTDTGSGLGLEDGLEIMECGGLSFFREGNMIHIRTEGEGGGSLSLSLRSGSTAADPFFADSESTGFLRDE